MMISKRVLFASLLIISACASAGFLHAQRRINQFYELRFYHFQTAEQEKLLDEYFEKALIPALHRQKILQVGIFKPIANDTAADKLVISLVPLKNPGQAYQTEMALVKDAVYNTAAATFLSNTSYKRLEKILLQKFSLAATLQKPALSGKREDRVYELRSYESASEKLYHNKVHMFNEGDEIGLFKNLNFNAVFYGEVITGSKMPNLMYMTSFENMKERDAHWKAFVASDAWKKLSGDLFYKGNVSHIDIWLMRPTGYSDY